MKSKESGKMAGNKKGVAHLNEKKNVKPAGKSAKQSSVAKVPGKYGGMASHQPKDFTDAHMKAGFKPVAGAGAGPETTNDGEYMNKPGSVKNNSNTMESPAKKGK